MASAWLSSIADWRMKRPTLTSTWWGVVCIWCLKMYVLYFIYASLPNVGHSNLSIWFVLVIPLTAMLILIDRSINGFPNTSWDLSYTEGTQLDGDTVVLELKPFLQKLRCGREWYFASCQSLVASYNVANCLFIHTVPCLKHICLGLVCRWCQSYIFDKVWLCGLAIDSNIDSYVQMIHVDMTLL